MKKLYLSIPQPCHEDWNNMSAKDKGRFCASCQKVVVDFTSMSDRQLGEFFKKPQNHICGRFQEEQLDRKISIPRKRIPWIKYFFQFALPAFLISIKVSAQKIKLLPEVIATSDCTKQMHKLSAIGHVPIAERKEDAINNLSKEITPKIVLPFNAKITSGVGLQNSEERIMVMGMVATRRATEPLWIVDGEICSSFDAMKIEPERIEKITILKGNDAISLYGNKAMSGVMIVITKQKKTVDTNQAQKSTSDKNIGSKRGKESYRFFIYPNSILNGTSTKLNLKEVELGIYYVTIISTNGAIIQNKEVIVESKNQIIDFSLKDVSAGTYFVRLINKNTGKYFTEKIVVQ